MATYILLTISVRMRMLGEHEKKDSHLMSKQVDQYSLGILDYTHHKLNKQTELLALTNL